MKMIIKKKNKFYFNIQNPQGTVLSVYRYTIGAFNNKINNNNNLKLQYLLWTNINYKRV